MRNDLDRSDDGDRYQPLSEDELRRRAERLISEGRMPSFASLLAAMREAVAEVAQERDKKADE